MSAAVSSKEVAERSSWRYHAIMFVLAVFTAPYRRAFKLYTWRPLREIRAANGDRKVLIPLVRDWKTDKYAELQSVQVAATFCGGANFSILPYARSSNPIWIADALWFSSLMCSIWAIVTTIQTKSILDDLPQREQMNASLPEHEVQRMQRTILRYKKNPGINHWIMMFVWQFPSMTMAYAWCTFLSGLTVYMCTPLIRDTVWQDQQKVAITYLIVGFVGLVTYIFSTAFVYMSEKDFERSVANSRTSTRLNADELETGSSLSGARDPSQMRGQQETCSTERADAVQIARARALGGIEPGEQVKEEPDVIKRITKRQLLY